MTMLESIENSVSAGAGGGPVIVVVVARQRQWACVYAGHMSWWKRFEDRDRTWSVVECGSVNTCVDACIGTMGRWTHMYADGVET